MFICKHFLRLFAYPCSKLISITNRKWFLDKTGHVGLNNLLAAYPDKSAYAQCIFAFSAGPGKEPIVFAGRTDGAIVTARGPTDFGYDFM